MVNRRRNLVGKLAAAALAAGSLLALNACSGSARAIESPRLTPDLAQAKLPALPADGHAWHRDVSLSHSFDGVVTYSDCGAPAAAPSAINASWLTLDGDQASGFAWAVYQV